MRVTSHSDPDTLFAALDAELQRRSTALTEICVIGGSALNAAGFINRPTKDVDVLAVGSRRGGRLLLEKSRPLPAVLIQASAAVAEQFQIEPDWLNAGPADLMDHGLPVGFETRLVPRTYGPALTVHFAGRLDQICFKLYAAADVGGRHLVDLQALGPTEEEMRFALEWVRQQDDSEGFRAQLAELFDYLGMSHVIAER
ncbi:MAG: hypothetical protein ABFC80_06585 [Coriobacteriales bacterium]|nr:hypothetical protein [Actinomycetes bacterium]